MKKIVETSVPIYGGTGTLWRSTPQEPTVGDDCFIYDASRGRFAAARYLGIGQWSTYPAGKMVSGPVYWQRAGSAILALERARARAGDVVQGWPLE